MKTTDNGRALARSRANKRLRNLTIGTAMLGVAATGSLGWLAAMTYDGSNATTAAMESLTATGVTTAAGTTATATTATTTTTASTTTTSATATAPAATPSATAGPVVVAAGGPAHASTGGS